MPTGTVTVTAKIGIAAQLTAKQFTNCATMLLDFDNKKAQILTNGQLVDVDLTANTGMTVTCTSTSNAYTITVV